MDTAARLGIRVGLWLMLLALLWPQAALGMPEDIVNSLPADARELWEEIGVDTADHTTLREGGRRLLARGKELCLQALRERAEDMLRLLAAVLLCSMAGESTEALGHSFPYGALAGVLVITVTAVGSMESIMTLAGRTLEELDVFGKAILPAMTAAAAAAGGVISAGAHQAGTVFFANFLLTVNHQLFMPLVYDYIALLAVDAILPEHPLKMPAQGIKKAVSGTLTASLVVFTAYLTIAGAVTSAGDRLSTQAAKAAVSAAVPVVGGIISEAAVGVFSSAALMKSSIGIIGVLGVLATCLVPFVTVGAHFLLYKLTSFLAGTMGQGSLVEYLDALSGAFALVLGMVGSCGLLFLLSLTTSLSVVIG